MLKISVVNIEYGNGMSRSASFGALPVSAHLHYSNVMGNTPTSRSTLFFKFLCISPFSIIFYCFWLILSKIDLISLMLRTKVILIPGKFSEI